MADLSWACNRRVLFVCYNEQIMVLYVVDSVINNLCVIEIKWISKDFSLVRVKKVSFFI